MLNTSSWVPIGPAPIATKGTLSPISGRVAGVATHPSNLSVLCIAADVGGVWITSDAWPGPPSWSPRTDQQSSLHFSGYQYRPLAIHPKTPQLVVGVASGTGGALLKSTDGGTSWNMLAAPFAGTKFGTIALDPTDVQVMYVCAGQAGVFKSVDGGASWGQGPLPLPTGVVWDLLLDPSDPSARTLYAAILQASSASNNGIYTSSDGGGSWNLVNGGLPDAPSLKAATAVRLAAGPGVICVAILTQSQTDPTTGTIARYRIPHGGNLWTPLNPTPNPTPKPTEGRFWHLLLGVDPQDADHVFVNDAYSLYETIDGGVTWTRADAGQGWLSSGNACDWVNIAFDSAGNAILAADQGVFRYQPTTHTWASLVGNLQVSEFYTVALDPNDVGTVYAIGQDLGTVKGTGIPLALEWSLLESAIGEVGTLLVDPRNSQLVHGFNPADHKNLVRRSTDGGTSWTTLFATTESASDGVGGLFQYAFVMDPSNPDRLLFGTSRVYETQNASAPSPTYTAISGVLSSNKYISSLAIAQSNSSTIYAATTDGHVWRMVNGGTSWEAVDGGISVAGLPVSDLSVDPSQPDHVFAVTQAGLWELSPGPDASTWAFLDVLAGASPAGQMAQTVFVDWATSPPALYVGTDHGVRASFDHGASWKNFDVGLPHTSINRLVGGSVNAGNGMREVVLAAATFGRGAWEILLRVLPYIPIVNAWAIDPLALLLGGESRAYINFTLPDPPPPGVLLPQLRTLFNTLGPGEQRQVLARVNALAAFAQAVQQGLQGLVMPAVSPAAPDAAAAPAAPAAGAAAPQASVAPAANARNRVGIVVALLGVLGLAVAAGLNPFFGAIGQPSGAVNGALLPILGIAGFLLAAGGLLWAAREG
jgi:hypothetical protein